VHTGLRRGAHHSGGGKPHRPRRLRVPHQSRLPLLLTRRPSVRANFNVRHRRRGTAGHRYLRRRRCRRRHRRCRRPAPPTSRPTGSPSSSACARRHRGGPRGRRNAAAPPRRLPLRAVGVGNGRARAEPPTRAGGGPRGAACLGRRSPSRRRWGRGEASSDGRGDSGDGCGSRDTQAVGGTASGGRRGGVGGGTCGSVCGDSCGGSARLHGSAAAAGVAATQTRRPRTEASAGAPPTVVYARVRGPRLTKSGRAAARRRGRNASCQGSGAGWRERSQQRGRHDVEDKKRKKPEQEQRGPTESRRQRGDKRAAVQNRQSEEKAGKVQRKQASVGQPARAGGGARGWRAAPRQAAGPRRGVTRITHRWAGGNGSGGRAGRRGCNNAAACRPAGRRSGRRAAGGHGTAAANPALRGTRSRKSVRRASLGFRAAALRGRWRNQASRRDISGQSRSIQRPPWELAVRAPAPHARAAPRH